MGTTLRKVLTTKQLEECGPILDVGTPHHGTLVHIVYSGTIDKAASKDFNFGQVVINRRIANGYEDV